MGWSAGYPFGGVRWSLRKIAGVSALMVGMALFATTASLGPAGAQSSATIVASTTNDWVEGRGFTPGGSAVVDINGSSSSVSLAVDGGFFIFANVDLLPGDVISVDDGTTVKSLTLADITFDSLDPGTDIGSGTAAVADGAAVDVVLDVNLLHTTLVTGGAWSFDFTAVAEDVGWDSNGSALLTDGDGDQTLAEGAAPRFESSLSNDWVSATGLAPNTTATVVVNGSVMAVTTDREGRFFHDTGIDLAPGDVIVVDDGANTKSLTLADIAFNVLDPATDIGSGTAAVPDGTTIEVNIEGPAHDTTVSGGAWSFDFSTVGEDVGPDSMGAARLADTDADRTISEGWTPRTHASLTNDWVTTVGFVPHGTVSVDINGSVTSIETDSDGRIFFETGFDLLPGDVITVDDGTFMKSSTLADITFDQLDPATDTGSGTAAVPDGTTIEVAFEGPPTPTTVTGGAWSFNFGAAGGDIGNTSHASVALPDSDADRTVAEGSSPRIDASLSNNWIGAQGLALNAAVSVDVNGSASAVMTEREGRFFFEPPGADLLPGDVITVDDGVRVKVLTLADISFDVLDPATDIGSGTAAVPDGTTIRVHIDGPPFEVTVTGGSWSFDFGAAGHDVRFESDGVIRLGDDDGDDTVADQSAPRIEASLTNDWVAAVGLVPNGTATVDVNGSASSVPVDRDGRFFFETGIDLVPGDLITVDDGTNVKSLTLADITFDSLDPVTDVASGTAAVPDGTTIEVGIEGPGFETTVLGGAWSFDFSGVGIDVPPGSTGRAEIDDAEADRTVVEFPSASDVLECGSYAGTIEELEAQGFTVIIGTDERDVVRMTGGDRYFVVTFGGNDWVRTGSGNDVICTGDGNDTIRTGSGDDLALGGEGRDRIRGQAGDDDLRGEAGNDRLFGGNGNDILGGGAGNDTIYANGGDDEMAGDDGNDRLYGGAGDDSMAGGPGFDRCNGGSGSNSSDGTCELVIRA